MMVFKHSNVVIFEKLLNSTVLKTTLLRRIADYLEVVAKVAFQVAFQGE
jgi:hypothetical protein